MVKSCIQCFCIIFALSSCGAVRSGLSSHYLRVVPFEVVYLRIIFVWPVRSGLSSHYLRETAVTCGCGPANMAEPVAMAAAPAEAAQAEASGGQPAAPAAPKAKVKRGESGLPPHVRPMQTAMGTKFFARLAWLPAGATSKKDGGRYDVIPGGPWLTPEGAAAAQAAAQALLTSSGAEAVWPKGLPGATGPRRTRDAAYWEAELAAREEKAAEKAAKKAAREAAEALRPKKPRHDKAAKQTTVPLPADREEVTNKCVRDVLVDAPAAGTKNAATEAAPVQCSPVPVPPGLDVMQANV
jgi:hypothetical protein